MHDRSVRFDRPKAMRAADAALVAHRLYQLGRRAALPRGATLEQADAWREAWPPSGATEVETVVDAVIASGSLVEADLVTITGEQAHRLRKLINWVHGSGRHPDPRFSDEELLKLMRALRGGA